MTHKIDNRAQLLVAARKNASPLPEYPGEIPQTLVEAYSVQNDAISIWEDEVKGWKVGGINGAWREKLGETRLLGPIFSKRTHKFEGRCIDMSVFAAGFAAVEAEVTAVISKDVPNGITDFTTEDALEYVESLHVGVEIASSPFPGINDYGPLLTISDFGNNCGMILGKKIPEWQSLKLDEWEFETTLNGVSVGKGTPTSAPGGPVESVRSALQNTAQRGLPLKKGMVIVTGAITGIHEVSVGDASTVKFCGEELISCRIVAAS